MKYNTPLGDRGVDFGRIGLLNIVYDKQRAALICIYFEKSACSGFRKPEFRREETGIPEHGNYDSGKESQ